MTSANRDKHWCEACGKDTTLSQEDWCEDCLKLVPLAVIQAVDDGCGCVCGLKGGGATFTFREVEVADGWLMGYRWQRILVHGVEYELEGPIVVRLSEIAWAAPISGVVSTPSEN